jgi:D-alanyl-D-alanine carboxypeptidase
MLSATASPGPFTPAATRTIDPGTRLHALLDDRRQSLGAPGAIALIRLNGHDWWAASGSADVDGTAIGRGSRFRIASITKPIVAALVVDAAERGELELDAVVADLLPGKLREEPAVTVRQLLDHTSGIFDEGNEGDPVADMAELPPALRNEAEQLYGRYLAGQRVIVPAEILVALAETHDRYFAPGTGIHYSNINYQLAAMVLERATGMTLDRLLEDRVVKPLGLTQTSIAPPDVSSPEVRGYATGEDGSLVDLTDDLATFGNGGNGGIISTADELLTIIRAIAAGHIVAPPLLAELTTPNLSNYGLGIVSYSMPCGTFLGHGGSVNGTISIAIASADGGDGVVIVMNRETTNDPLPDLAAELLCS